MGRIADALKRAEHDRRVAAGLPTDAAPDTVSIPDLSAASYVGDVASGESGTATDGGEPYQRSSAVMGLPESLVPFSEPASLVAEQYRSLRTRLVSQNPQYEHRMLAITSAVPKEGKSVTTLNLGCTLAEIRHLNVLVVDGDFRRSSLARLLNQPEGPGLADVLSGEVRYEDVLCGTPIPNLTLMPAGSAHGRSAAELLSAATAKPTFKRMLNDFHYTIIDTPPATTVTDVGIIGQMCHGVIMVVRLHRTHEAAAKRAVRLLQVNNVPILGCMIVGRDAPSDRYAYGYHYGDEQKDTQHKQGRRKKAAWPDRPTLNKRERQ